MTGAGVIDRPTLDALLESFGGDLEFFGEMLDTFFADSPEQIAAAQTGLSRGDCELVRRAAHSLKSNCANFGALALSARCKELEMLARGGSLDGGAQILAVIEAGYGEAQVALEALRVRG